MSSSSQGTTPLPSAAQAAAQAVLDADQAARAAHVGAATGIPAQLENEAIDRADEARRLFRELVTPEWFLAYAAGAEPFIRLADELINARPTSDSYMEWLVEAKDWLVVFSFAGKSITLGDLRRAAATCAGVGS